jgi:hypothetical protein
MAERNTLGILGDFPNTPKRVIDVKGRDSRREVDRWNALLDFYRDQVWVPENLMVKH